MSRSILLDTCAAIWIVDDETIEPEAETELARSAAIGLPVLISPVVAWEIGMLVSRHRYASRVPVDVWFSTLLSQPGAKMADFSPAILIQSSFLPGNPPRDPFDRLFVATARAHGYRLMTRDRKILDYAAQGHVEAVPC